MQQGCMPVIVKSHMIIKVGGYKVIYRLRRDIIQLMHLSEKDVAAVPFALSMRHQHSKLNTDKERSKCR